jgi:membrane dipeptidase
MHFKREYYKDLGGKTKFMGRDTTISDRLIDPGDIIIDGACAGMYWNSVFDHFCNGGYTAQLITVHGLGDVKDGIDAYKSMHQFIHRNQDRMMLVTSVSQIHKAKAEGKIGVIFHLQGAENLGADPGNLEIHWRLGLRVLQLAYNRRNYWCEGCLERGPDPGLSNLGRRLIAECNRLGIVIDGSHTSWRSVTEACELSGDPVICSHSNPYAVHQNRRNISDEVIYAIADTGGVVGINGFPLFVSDEQPARMDTFINHFSYVSDLVGSHHLATGLDYFFRDFGKKNWNSLVAMGCWDDDAYPPGQRLEWPQGLDDISAGIPNLAQGLSEGGFSKGEITGILGGNLLRVFNKVWHPEDALIQGPVS